jgi:hypothetical protein
MKTLYTKIHKYHLLRLLFGGASIDLCFFLLSLLYENVYITHLFIFKALYQSTIDSAKQDLYFYSILVLITTSLFSWLFSVAININISD